MLVVYDFAFRRKLGKPAVGVNHTEPFRYFVCEAVVYKSKNYILSPTQQLFSDVYNIGGYFNSICLSSSSCRVKLYPGHHDALVVSRRETLTLQLGPHVRK